MFHLYNKILKNIVISCSIYITKYGKLSHHVFSSPQVPIYSDIRGLKENDYGPRNEQRLASYLSLSSASHLKGPMLLTKPLKMTSTLVGKAYMAVGLHTMHTMSILQAYQADLLRDDGKGWGLTRFENYVRLQICLSVLQSRLLDLLGGLWQP